LGDTHSQRDRVGHGQGCPFAALRKVLALEPLHGEKKLTSGCGTMCDVPNDARMIELGKHVAFAREVSGKPNAIGMEHFERDRRTGRAIDSPVNHGHAAGTSKPLDFETARNKLSPGHGEKIARRNGKRKEALPTMVRWVSLFHGDERPTTGGSDLAVGFERRLDHTSILGRVGDARTQQDS
jgi:hypothetical protein